jgi:hypothetical protein
MNFNEINPGIVKLVAMLQAHGFNTTDSGDGVTNVPLMECVLETPHVFMKVDPDKMIAESNRLYELMRDKANFDQDIEMIPPQPTGAIEVSYSPIDKTAVIALLNLDDDFVFGPNPNLARDRLGYQIRFCDAVLAREPTTPTTERAFYRQLRSTLASELAKVNDKS